MYNHVNLFKEKTAQLAVWQIVYMCISTGDLKRENIFHDVNNEY